MARLALDRTVHKSGIVPTIPSILDRLTISPRVIVIMFGLLSAAFAVIMPPFQFNDEDGHFIRAYELSCGQFIARKDDRVSPAVIALLREFPEQLNINSEFRINRGAPGKIPVARIASSLFHPVRVMGPDEQPILNDPGHYYMPWAILGTKIYCSIAYAPAALGILLARALHLPPLCFVYLARLFNVLTVATALALACRIAHGYRVLFAGVAFLPMTLSQAGAISADSITIACSMAGFAMVLRAREKCVSNLFLSALLVLFMVWGLCKTSIWALPLILLVPRSRFSNALRWFAYLGAVALAMAAGVLFWQIVNAENVRVFAAYRLVHGIDTSANMLQLVHHPFQFGGWMFHVIQSHYRQYLRQFVGGFGWLWVGLRLRNQIPALCVFAMSALATRISRPLSVLERALLLFVFFGAFVLIHAILFVSDGSPPPSRPSSFQGRYMIPFCLAGLLAITPRKTILAPNVGSFIILFTGTTYGILSLVLIKSIYYL